MLLTVLSIAVALAVPGIGEPVRSGASSPADAAVVIGFESYPLLGVDVRYARADASAFYDTLVYTRGVPPAKVHRLESASRSMILDAVAAASSEVGPGGTLWVYFAGHGAADPKTGARLLLADDVRADPRSFSASGVSVAALEDEAGAHPMMIVLDTCYVGLGRDGTQLTDKRPAIPHYAFAAGPETRVWTATSGSEFAGTYEPGRHGAFTYFAVGALRGWADGELNGTPDGTVTLIEAQAYVDRALRLAQTRGQTPTLSGEDLVLSTGRLEEDPEKKKPSPPVVQPKPVPAAVLGTPADARRLMRTGDTHREQKQYAEAGEPYAKAAAIWLALAQAEIDKGSWSAAIPHLETACMELARTKRRAGADTCALLGQALEAGLGIPTDAQRARALYKRGCLGEGFILQPAEKSPIACRKHAEVLQAGCDAGTANACNYLAGFYRSGNGVEKDIGTALRLYERTCTLGGAYAGLGCVNLGRILAEGRYGVTQDVGKAVTLLERGCGLHDGRSSCSALGVLYRDGEHVTKDPDRAKHWFNIYCEQDSKCVSQWLTTNMR